MSVSLYQLCSKLRITLLFTVLYSCLTLSVSAKNRPSLADLNVNLLFNTEQTFINGYLSATPLNKAVSQKENLQFINISTQQPTLGWNIKSDIDNILQTAYRVSVASSLENILNDSIDLWDSGKINSSLSSNIRYQGKPLEPDRIYYWRVKIWDNNGNESDHSSPSHFKTASVLTDYATDRYPIQKQDEYPREIEQFDETNYFVDFGKAAFGRIRINLFSENGTDTVTLHLGEAQKGGQVNRDPGGSIRYSKYTIVPIKGWNNYIVTVTPDERNTGSQAILIPEYIGEVTPFRYCEIENYKYPLQKKDIVRETAFYPFNESDSYFHSSDSILNKVWDISKYSIKATSFLGVYVDGDRERIPYEADAIINQLSHYCVARDFNMARYSHEYLISNPTWPTEWILQSVLMAWEDYKYSGNKLSLEHFYPDLKAKTLTALSDESGFISTRTGKVTPEVMETIHFKGNIRDIVDWPHPGSFGMTDDKYGETDGFVFTDVNTVVNAYHYRSLVLIAQIAEVLGNETDYNYFSEKAAKLKRNFNNQLFDKKRGVYVDGIGTDHTSLHANMFPLAFGLVEDKNVDKVLNFIRSRGMACSVYGSQFLLDGIYEAGDADYALQLLTSTGDRSWYNMIRSGSTITTEAWDNKFKPNQDWNHAWGAAPANLIPRKLMGIEPLEPGFRKIRIKPQPGSLESAEIKHPTIQGDIFVKFENIPGESFRLDVKIPANTTAEIYLPNISRNQKVMLNNKPIKYSRTGDFIQVETLGSGKWEFFVYK